MDIERAVQALRMHNKWRRGELQDMHMQHPTQIGIAIDVLVKYVQDKIDTCIVEPIPSKNYCPKCGAKIEIDEKK